MILNYKASISLLALGIAISASAAPEVSYTSSGTSGDYTLDFSVTDTLGGSNNIYFFGVYSTTGRDITGSPPGFDPNVWSSWNNSGYGGDNTTYNNVWISGQIEPGQTVSGFDVLSTAATVPTSVDWFAYAYGGVYTGGDNFWVPTNPGFQGVAGTPSPAAVIPMLGGLVGLAFRRRKA